MSNEDGSSRLEISNRNKELIREVFELEADGHKDAREIFKEEILGFLIQTDDGSFTLSSGERNDQSETLHSTFGARTEAFEKFVIPSKLLEKADTNNVIKVLDICSGIGYNVSALLDYLKDSDVEIEIDMVESSLETVATTLFIPISFLPGRMSALNSTRGTKISSIVNCLRTSISVMLFLSLWTAMRSMRSCTTV